MSEYTEVSKETAKEMIDNAEFGFLILHETEPIPSLGSIPPDERKVKITSEVYSFGELREREA